MLLEGPAWLLAWCRSRNETRQPHAITGELGEPPDYIKQRMAARTDPSTRVKLMQTPWSIGEERRVLSALDHIPALQRDDWLRIGMALHDSGWERAFAIWCEWSRTSPEKYNEADQERTWKSFDRQAHGRNRITLATVFRMAIDRGWREEIAAVRPSGEEPKAPKVGDAKRDEAVVEIAELAKLDVLQYEQARKAAADRLEVRATVLDDLVKAERTKLHGDDKQGHALLLAEPDPWPELVNGAELLNELALSMLRHVVMSNEEASIAALWTIHTYLLDCFGISPRLAITSPEKGCGKTTLLDILTCLVFRSLPAANATAAAIFRIVESQRPTLLIDEADTFLPDNEELRGILNSGHRKGGAVIRTVGEDFEPRSFSTYSPCAIALIGRLPPTLHDRSVHIELRRRRPDEPIVSFRHDRTNHLTILRRKAARWAADNGPDVRAADPEMPSGTINRAADNWCPLLAIADVAGGPWPGWARQVIQSQQASAADGDDSARVLLLADIRSIFAERAVDRLSSSELVSALMAREGRPWAEWKAGKPITVNRLARLLAPFAIAPATIRKGGETPKGYLLAQFEDAFTRYLPGSGS